MSNESILAPATDTEEAPEQGRLNDRGETYFEGLREYECLSDVCRERGDLIELGWDDALIHTASYVTGDGWSVQVEWWPSEQAWRVYGSLIDIESRIGSYLERDTAEKFHEALEAAYERADALNALDVPENPDVPFMVECAERVTAHLPHNGIQFGEALVWLTRHPQLQKVPARALVAALNDAAQTGNFGAVK